MLTAAVFILFCAVCTVLAFVRHPIWGLYLYFAATYVFPPGRWWGPMFGDVRWSLLAAGVTILAIVFHLGKLREKPPWHRNVPAVALVLYALWMGVQTPWAVDVTTHIAGATQFAKCIVAFW